MYNKSIRTQEQIGFGCVRIRNNIEAIGSVLARPVRPVSATGQTGLIQNRANGSNASLTAGV